jgi:2-polyprenyl-3-methyl-5-hydroxy-6-metoxy-1,4-benzoquinol methylase
MFLTGDKKTRVSKTDVVNCYKYLLSRKPESEDSINWQIENSENVRDLVNRLIRSDEFSGNFGMFLTGMHLDDCSTDVRIEYAENYVPSLFARTVNSWRQPDSDFIDCPSSAEELSKFYAGGQYEVDRIEALLRRNRLDFHPLNVCIDFGCGIGRLSMPLAARHKQIIGVDISPNRIELARKASSQHAIENISYQILKTENDIDALPSCDIAICIRVLQYNPPPLSYDILKRLLSRVGNGGIAVFQAITFRKGYTFEFESYLRSARSKNVEIHALPQRFIFKAISESNFDILEVREDLVAYLPDTVSQTFLVKRR